MLCPKCGQEYEGTECPNCQAPKIIVNNTDYQKRREAYEKKQAALKSASSRNAAIEEEQSVQTVVSSDKRKTPTDTYEEINYLEVMRKVRDTGKELAGNAVNKLDLNKGKATIKKYLKPLIILLVLLCAVSAVGVGIYRLAVRKNYVLYMSSNQKIYNVAGLESDYVCDRNQAVFAVDNQTFYTPVFPAELDKDNLLSVLSSNHGEYFAGVLYHEESAKYALYTWKADGSNLKLVSENLYQKEIKYITDKGKIIYTDVEVINEEGGLGNIQLYVYDSSEKLILIEQYLRGVYIYAGQEKILCYNKDQVLYTYDYNTLAVSEVISEETKSIYAESVQDNFFTSKAETVNTSKSADAVIYSENGSWYYYDFAEHKSHFISQETGSNAEFVYEEKGGYVYILLPNKISYGEITAEGITGLTVVDELSSEDYIYLDEKNELIYRNAAQKLCSLSKNKKTVIDSDVVSGSLSAVGNTDTGFTYIKENAQYYRASIGADAVRMCEVSEGTNTTDTLFYKNRLYFYDAQGQLYSCTKKGKDLNKVGEVERFWLGTEYK